MGEGSIVVQQVQRLFADDQLSSPPAAEPQARSLKGYGRLHPSFSGRFENASRYLPA
jgi:hypothetical protein